MIQMRRLHLIARVVIIMTMLLEIVKTMKIIIVIGLVMILVVDHAVVLVVVVLNERDLLNPILILEVGAGVVALVTMNKEGFEVLLMVIKNKFLIDLNELRPS
jgi:hypothetical protein